MTHPRQDQGLFSRQAQCRPGEKTPTIPLPTLQGPVPGNIAPKLGEISHQGGLVLGGPTSFRATRVVGEPPRSLCCAGSWGDPEPRTFSASHSRRRPTVLQGSHLGYKSLTAQ